MIAMPDAWTSARVEMFAEDLEARALTQISVTHRQEASPAMFKIVRRSPHDSLHGFYRALILAHGERVT
jgi:hypothetical protein